MRRLSELALGQSTRISGFCAHSPYAARLKALGFRVGAPVKCVCVAPFGKTAVYRTDEGFIALRNNEADAVFTDLPDKEVRP